MAATLPISAASAIGLLGLAVACVTSDPRLETAHVRAQIEGPTPPSTAAAREAAPIEVPPGVRLDDGVTGEEAVSLALWNNTAFQEQLAALGLSRADLAQAGMIANPTAAVLIPLGAKQLEYAATLPLEALWIRPGRVAVARLEGERAAERLVQTGLDLIRDVRAATAEVVATRERAEIARGLAAASDEIAEIAERRLEIGDASDTEAALARVDAARARDELRTARSEADAAQRRWESGIGFGDRERSVSLATGELAERCGERAELDALLEQALSARPDLRAARLGVQAAEERAGLARAEIFAVSAILDANGSGRDREMGPGLSLVLPILNQNQGGRVRAAAELARAEAGRRATEDRILLEVSDASARRDEAAERRRAWQGEIVAPLAAGLAVVEGQLAAGDVSPLAALQARRTLELARLREVELRALEAHACAELERSVGLRFVGAPT
ncbi:MAG TPA: TolC family protein [Myxococcota bacterium]|jgi:cobalt-zinc-cadmium efflux system outer membrane protein